MEPNKIPNFSGLNVSTLEQKMIQKQKQGPNWTIIIVIIILIIFAAGGYAGWFYYKQNIDKISSPVATTTTPSIATNSTTTEMKKTATSSESVQASSTVEITSDLNDAIDFGTSSNTDEINKAF